MRSFARASSSGGVGAVRGEEDEGAGPLLLTGLTRCCAEDDEGPSARPSDAPTAPLLWLLCEEEAPTLEVEGEYC